MRVGTSSWPARTTLSASISRESSPPDAVLARGRASSPWLSRTVNVTCSPPCACGSASGSIATSSFPPGRPSWGRSLPTARPSRPAASVRLAVSFAAASRSAASAATRLVASARRSVSAVSSRSSSRAASSPVARTEARLPPCFWVSLKRRSRRCSTSAWRAGSSLIPSAYSLASRASSVRLAKAPSRSSRHLAVSGSWRSSWVSDRSAWPSAVSAPPSSPSIDSARRRACSPRVPAWASFRASASRRASSPGWSFASRISVTTCRR